MTHIAIFAVGVLLAACTQYEHHHVDEQHHKAMSIAVTDAGFTPHILKVKAGRPVKLVVTRHTESECGAELVIKDLEIKRPLPLHEPVTIEFTPQRRGRIAFACGMDMMRGEFVVE